MIIETRSISPNLSLHIEFDSHFDIYFIILTQLNTNSTINLYGLIDSKSDAINLFNNFKI